MSKILLKIRNESAQQYKVNQENHYLPPMTYVDYNAGFDAAIAVINKFFEWYNNDRYQLDKKVLESFDCINDFFAYYIEFKYKP